VVPEEVPVGAATSDVRPAARAAAERREAAEAAEAAARADRMPTAVTAGPGEMRSDPREATPVATAAPAAMGSAEEAEAALNSIPVLPGTTAALGPMAKRADQAALPLLATTNCLRPGATERCSVGRVGATSTFTAMAPTGARTHDHGGYGGGGI
jgi:hypothetical protein